jgi:hypothetical protein
MGHHESEETYLAIGRFIFEFSQLEHSLRVYIAEKCDLPEETAMVVVNHDFSMLCTVASKVLAEPNNPAAETALAAIISQCRRHNDTRVRVSHGLWIPFKYGGAVSHQSRSTLKETMSVNQTQELEKSAGEIAIVRLKLDQYMWGDFSPDLS